MRTFDTKSRKYTPDRSLTIINSHALPLSFMSLLSYDDDDDFDQLLFQGYFPECYESVVWMRGERTTTNNSLWSINDLDSNRGVKTTNNDVKTLELSWVRRRELMRKFHCVALWFDIFFPSNYDWIFIIIRCQPKPTDVSYPFPLTLKLSTNSSFNMGLDEKTKQWIEHRTKLEYC